MNESQKYNADQKPVQKRTFYIIPSIWSFRKGRSIVRESWPVFSGIGSELPQGTFCGDWTFCVLIVLVVTRYGTNRNVGFPGGSDSKESTCSGGDWGLISGSGRSPGEGNGNPLQCSCLENFMDREPGRLQSLGHKESDKTEQLTLLTFTLNFSNCWEFPLFSFHVILHYF